MRKIDIGVIQREDMEVKIIGLACGKSSVVFITNAGEIFECDSTVDLDYVESLKVAAGFDHILALTDKGRVYGWGANTHGQLNFNRNYGQAERLESPSEIHIPNVRKVSDIAAMKFMSAVKSSDDGLVYIQGCLHGKKIRRFAVCEYTNIFDRYNSSFHSLKENHTCTQEEHEIEDSLICAFNNRFASDLTIQVDGQSIYVHKSILKMRSSYFKNMFAFNEMQNRQRIIKYDDFPYDTYINFFLFLYSGWVSFTNPKKMIELMILSDKFCQTNLEKKCIKQIRNNLNSSNVSYIKEMAIQYNKMELVEYCYICQIRNISGSMQIFS
ncbi:PREDICTED: RCC1 and BTB domain-containing protein 1-like [Trachymyrmex cornetzi]|uniref:RCC1 and BTB domain-containing protein 1-like n=1 Tax=Trachymyrmex cornetzi TaxID=471704 RepID=UPI00084EF0E6|nr:PREDICTED: RCC1 and BTB domain-containing protein 1-like [Trachymyrmex cornetzi]